MALSFWLGVIGSWTLLFAQILSFYALKQKFKLEKYSNDESSLFALISVLFASPLLITLMMLFHIPYFVSQLILSLTIVTYIMAKKFRFKSKTQNKFDKVTTSSIIFIFGWNFYIASIKPESTIDGMLYHGQTLANILTRNGLWDWSVSSAYSYYTDLGMVVASQFSRISINVEFEDFVGTPYMILLFFLIKVTINSVAKSNAFSGLLSILILTTPVIWIQARILYVDLIYASALCAAIYILSIKAKLDSKLLILGALSIGALISIKPTGFAIAIILTATLFIRVVMAHKAKNVNKKTLLLMFIFLSSGLSFYIRNFAQWGNPFYPVRIRFGAFDFGGIIDYKLFAADGEGASSFFSLSRILNFGSSVARGLTFGMEKLDYDPRISGFSRIPLVVLAILFLAVSIGKLLSIIKSKNKNLYILANYDQDKGKNPRILIMILLTIVTLSLQPNSFNSRYTIGPYIISLLIVIRIIFKLNPIVKNQFFFPSIFTLLFIFLNIRWVENNVFLGLRSIENSKSQILNFNSGISGGSFQQENAFDWVPKSSCVSIYVESGPGVTAGGMTAFSVSDLFTYGFYGNRLCNEVTFVSGGIPRNLIEKKALEDADYIVSFTENREKINSLSPKCTSKLGNINNPASSYIGEPKSQVFTVKNRC
jgi:hypothetical protein